MYGNARERLTRLHATLLAGNRITVLFCVRSYDEFLASAYCEALRHHPFCTFDEFFSLDDLSEISWPNVLESISTVFQGSPLVVWDFETFKNNPTRIAATVAGVPESSFGALATISRASMSARAVAHLTSLRRTMNDDEIRNYVYAAELAFPPSDYTQFRPFSESSAKRLRELYHEHFAQIRRGFGEAAIVED